MHYVILYDYSFDKIGEANYGVVGVCHDSSSAINLFKEKVALEKAYAKEHGWIIYNDTATLFEAGEDGYYNINHTSVRLQTVQEDWMYARKN
jgi:hypothetical protein